MAFDTINIGAAPNDGTGDTLRTGGGKINDNFAKAVEGPASAVTTNRMVVFDGTDGRLVKQAAFVEADVARLSETQTFTGTKTFTQTVSGGKFAPTANTVAGNGMYLADTNTLAFSTDGAERLRVTSAGNVGIGGTPSGRFNIYRDSGDAIAISSNLGSSANQTGARIRFSNTFGNNSEGLGVAAIGWGTGSTSDSGFLEFFTSPSNHNPTVRMSIRQTGRVHVRGRATETITVSNAANGTSAAPAETAMITGMFQENSDAAGMYHVNQFFSNGACYLRFKTTNTTGSITTRMEIGPPGTIQFNAYGAGTLSTNASGVISASDGRFKTKTRPVEDALAAVAALQPTYFKWDEDSPFASDDEELGFIAQEVAAVIPAASPGEDEEGRFRNYNDRAIIAVLVKGMQELKAELDELKAKLEEQSDD